MDKPADLSRAHLRIARPSDDLDAVTRFYRDGLGFSVLSEFRDHDGFDGVMLFGCKYGDDYQCHFIRGSEVMDTRGDNVKEKLQQMALENERVQLHQVQISDYDQIPGLVNEFMETIEEVGMNPFKGM